MALDGVWSISKLLTTCLVLGQLARPVVAVPVVDAGDAFQHAVMGQEVQAGHVHDDLDLLLQDSVSDEQQADTVTIGSLDDDEERVETTNFPRPSWWVSTLRARRLLALAKTGVVSTVFPDRIPPNSYTPPDVAGVSVPLPEYVADCDEALPDGNGGDGSPTFVGLKISTTFRNTAAGSNISLSLDWWDHLDETRPIYPGFPLSPAGLPRVTLFGYVVPFETPLPKGTQRALESCYLAKHPDSRVWLPGQRFSPHESFWAKMVVTHAYWIGGFGDTQQIGWINLTEWSGIRRKGSLPGVGDGRGWDDVRLPGEPGY
ncbi:hypothetical protein Plec18167_003121 [Paecilomyces lecythidis]|uniref:CREG-like beta-barrel domain-containing protein n=1 Tax=Paecilomyces lecythidis TaxID=3004212 RepID=A0ABR3Y0R9_9EURO